MNLGKENETIEFKETTSELKEAIKSICAMLNKQGFGTVYFGVFPNGEIKGQNVEESTLRKISKRIYKCITPQIIPSISVKIMDGKNIIEITFNGTNRPYSDKGVYYIRVADEDRILPTNELRQMFEYNKNDSWDEKLVNFGIKDVDLKQLFSFYNRAITSKKVKDSNFNAKKILIKLGLLKNNKLTNAGHYLFSKHNPITLKLAIFATDEKLTFLDIKRVEGNIYSLIEEAYEYITKNIRWESKIIDRKRIDIPEIPLKSLREIICNSFAHARYDSFTQHEITIHPGKIRIYNPGEFPIGYKPEDFAFHDIPSKIRNPLILKTLFLSDDIESYSSGFKRVFSECKENNIKIEYIIAKEGFTFIFKRHVINNDCK